MERLQKVIANKGYCSRRSAEELISKGKVSVNGSVVTTLGTKVEPTDTIEVEGIMLDNEIVKKYYLLNKPRGYICSNDDDKGRKTVVELINTNERIYPIGRLDYDTTGILLLTNDGEFANKLMHPKNGISKTYLAKLSGIISKEAIDMLKKGVVVDGKKVKIVDFKIKRKDKKKNATYIEVTIIEGRNHIVKNIFKEIGYLVDKLTRVNYAFLTLDNLQSGEYRELSIKEVKKFYNY